MYHTILVPLDGSKRAEEILPHVETFANCFSARVILLQVIETIQAIDLEYPPNYVEETWISEVIQQAQAYFENLPWEYKDQQEVKILIEQGPIVQTIIRVAERDGADLIALASHGRTGLARVFYGSVAAGVLHRIDRPLLIIRADD
ncbi:MAG TPA: universal stress protein [Anaerolineales bacterium]|nr:universal stress protein [Anaerolineales bacterium]